ncbi:MAG: hypothetical protein HON23_03890 [Rickettsiales bacterium]|mgnify:CR=1 FL=1|jgi:Kdo2-lipid IVA lauroyltransferase/acyltransferase|nr:hypothetical protein [Rickettsiales bacterium]
MVKNIRYILECYMVKSFFFLGRILPLSIMSYYYAHIFLAIGSKFKANKVAKRNLKMIYPKKSQAEINEITDTVWKNLGHNFAEYPFLTSSTKEQFLSHVKITGVENLTAYTDKGRAVLMFSAHYSNWEVISCFLTHYEIKTNMIYRKMNNSYLDDLIIGMRRSKYFALHPKGRRNAVKIVQDLQHGVSFASFVDQKLNEGIKVPFLGKDAMSPPLLAQLANKYDYPLIPMYVKRLAHLEYELVIEPALVYKKLPDREKQVYEIMRNINKRLASWINKAPGQWFWVHNRWPK